MTFKLGDVVELVSGSPRMTVTRVPEGTFRAYVVTWFMGSRRSFAQLPREALLAAGPEVAAPLSPAKKARKA